MAYKMTAADRRALANIQARERQMKARRLVTPNSHAVEVSETKEEKANPIARGVGTVSDIGRNITQGAFKSVEGIVDLGAGLVGAVGGLFSDDFESGVKRFVETDWTGKYLDEINLATSLSGGIFGLVGGVAAYNQKPWEDSYLKEGGMVEQVAQGVGQMLPAVAISLATAGAAAPAAAGGTAASASSGVGAALSSAAKTVGSAAVKNAGMLTIGASAAGASTEEAFKDGASYGAGLGYGAVSGLTEMATERLLPGPADTVIGKGLLGGVKEVADQGIERVVKEVAKNAVNEGVEEGFSELTNPARKSIYKGMEAFEEYTDPEFYKGVGEATLTGMGTSVAFGGTVGKAMQGKGYNGDIQASLESIEALETERKNLQERGKLTAETEAHIDEQIEANYKQIESVLSKGSDEKRAEQMERHELGDRFDESGKLTERSTDTAGLDPRYYSADARGQERRIREILDDNNVTAFKGELTEKENAALREVYKAHNALSRFGYADKHVVIVDEMKKTNAFIDENVIVIGKDMLNNGQYINKLVHETTHFTEGSKEWSEVAKYVFGDGKNIRESLKTEIGEVVGHGYGVTEADVDAVIEHIESGYKTKLTGKQGTLIEEVVANRMGNIFSDNAAVERLCREKPSIAKRIWERIKALLDSIGKSSAEREEIKKLRETERLFREALETGGQAYIGDTIRNNLRQNDSGEKESPEEAKRSGKISDAKFSLKFAPDIAENQRKYYDSHDIALTEEELDLAINQAAEMVSVMEKYSDILPQDKVATKAHRILVKNGSYDYSVENTTICVRTLSYNSFVDRVSEKIGRPLSQMESFLVSQKLYDIAKEPQCLYCYVSLDRKAYNEMLLRYLEQRDTAVQAYKDAGMPEVSRSSQLYNDYLNSRKDTNEQWNRYRNWMSVVREGGDLLTAEDIATESRRAEIFAKGGERGEQIKDILKYAQSASWAKKQMDYVAYYDEILKLSEQTVRNLNKHYGLRWYSFSDYSAAFIVENMQQITDASLRGLKGLAYTKDTDFVKVFAPTGMNINISVYVKKDGKGGYVVDEKQSANIEEAIALRDEFSNVGIVVVATDHGGVEWALEQKWSDVVIPFHTVRTGADVAEFYNWEIFNKDQSDTVKDANLWEAYVNSVATSDSAKKKVSKMVYPSEHQNDKKTYLDICERRGLAPRFSGFVDNPNYMKLVNETRQSESATEPLKPIFDLEAAKESFGKFVDKGGYFEGWYNDGIDVDGEAELVAADVRAGKKANEVTYGRQDLDPDQLMASRRANRTHGGTVKRSGKKATELSETDLRELLEEAQYGVLEDRSYIPLRRNTPTFFIDVVKEHSKGSVFIEDYPLAGTVEHLRQNMEELDGQSYGEERPHELSIDDIVAISRKMGDPAYIVLQQNGRYAEVVSFYSGDSRRNKNVVVAIDMANSQAPTSKNYKYSQYLNGYDDGYYNIVVTQYEPDDLQHYLNNNTIVYDKKKMNGKYQVGSGRIVTVTHDTPFIEDIIPQDEAGVNSFAKKSRKDSRKVDSEGEKVESKISLPLLNRTRFKTYTRADVDQVISSILFNRLGFNDGSRGEIKNRGELADKLYMALNTAEKGKRAGVALDIAEYVIQHTAMKGVYDDAENAEFTETVSLLKPYLHSFNLSSIYEEMKHRYGKKKANGIRLLWGAPKGSGFTPDEVKSELEGSGFRIDSDNEADIFFEIADAYHDASEALKKKTNAMLDEVIPEDERKALKQDIARDILDGFELLGKPSMIATMLAEADKKAQLWKGQYYDQRNRGKAINRLFETVDRVRNIVDMKKADEEIAEEVENLVKLLKKIKTYRGNIAKNVRDIMKSYASEVGGTKLYDLISDKLDGEINPFAAEIESIAQGDGELSTREIEALDSILRNFIHNANNYKRIFLDGKRQEATEVIKQGVTETREALKVKNEGLLGVANKMKEHMQSPVWRFERLGCYRDNSVMVKLWREFQNGFSRQARFSMQVAEHYKEFFEKHKKEVDKWRDPSYEINGKKVSRGQMIGLYLTALRAQGREHLFGDSDNGTVLFTDEAVTAKSGAHAGELEGANAAVSAGDIIEFEASLTDTEREFIKLTQTFFNEISKNAKVETDEALYGVSNVVETAYYPLRVADDQLYRKLGDGTFRFADLFNLYSPSFNKATVEHARNKLVIENVLDVVNRHAKQMANYYGFASAVKTFNRVYNMKVDGVGNMRDAIRNVDRGFEDYVGKLVQDIQGNRMPKTGIQRTLSKVRGWGARAALAANLKVLATQFVSMPAAAAVGVQYRYVTKGFGMAIKRKTDVDKMFEYVPMLYDRFRNGSNIDVGLLKEGKGILGSLDKLTDLTTAPIGAVDSFVCCAVWNACLEQTKSKYTPYSEEHYKAAAELTESALIKTQANYAPLYRPAILRERDSFTQLLTMFMSEPLQQFSLISSSVEKLKVTRNLAENADDAHKAEYEKLFEEAKKSAAHALSAVFIDTVILTMIAQLFKWIKGKEDEDKVQGILGDFVENYVGMFPVIKDVYGYIVNGYDMTNMAYTGLTNIADGLTAMCSLIDLAVSGDAYDERTVRQKGRKVLLGISQTFGIPIRNLETYMVGIIEKLSPSTGMKYDDLFYSESASVYTDKLMKAVDNGNDRLADSILDIMLDEGSTDKGLRTEMRKLLGDGMDVLPRSVGETVTYNGESVTLTKKQKSRFSALYSVAGDRAAKLVKTSLYRKADSGVKSAAIKFIYDTYYNLALQEVVGEALESKNVLFAEAMDIEQLAIIVAYARSIEADKDRSGNSIAGSKKAKIERYIQSLGISAAEKYMMMGYLGYKCTNGANAVKGYINRLPLTKAEKERLYEYCGYVA